ncbi:hypothetical protein J6590_069876 [Homalodisca vitripennis]|nr:hypothetical protein J6590_069876 [Homalodisca vitripennis]
MPPNWRSGVPHRSSILHVQQHTRSASSFRHVSRHTRQQLGVVHGHGQDTLKKNKSCDLSPYIQTMELKHL